MHKFDWYVGRAVLMSTLAVLLLLVGLDALTSVVDETDDMSEGYGFSNILVYVGYTVPRRVHEFVPFAALIGALIALGRLATTSELVVMRAAQCSVLYPGLLSAEFGQLHLLKHPVVASVGGPLSYQHTGQAPVLSEAQQCEAISNPASLHRVNMDKRITVAVPGAKPPSDRRFRALCQGTITHGELLGMWRNEFAHRKTHRRDK